MSYKNWFKGLLLIGLINLAIAPRAIQAQQAEESAPEQIAQSQQEQGNQLTEASITQVLTQMDAATEKRDLQGLLKFIAPFAYSEVTIELPGQDMTYYVEGIKEHELFLSNTQSNIKERNIISRDTEILISEDGQMSHVKVYSLREFVTQDGKRFLMETDELLIFGLINNKPMMVSAKVKGWLAERPSQTPPK